MALRACLLAACATAASAAASADDFALVRARVLATIYPPADSLAAGAAAARTTAAALNASCFWPDIDYESTSRANWLTIAHIDRVLALALAVATPGSPALDDAALLAKTQCALDAWILRSKPFKNSNWYSWIGEETRLQTTFLVLGVNRTTPAEQSALVRFSYNSAWWVNDYGGGDNLSDMLRVELYRGLASANETAVAQAFSTLFSTAAVGSVTTPGFEGVCDDMAYLFHGVQMLSGAYGAGWAQTMLTLRSVAAGTKWAMPRAAVGVLARFLVEGDFAVTFGRRMDFGTQGRGIDRPGNAFNWPWNGAALRTLAADAGAAPWAAGLADYADALDGTAPLQPPSSKLFWSVDFYAHKRPTWGAAWKGHGNNSLWAVVGNECDNSENLLGELTASGALNIYTSAEPDNAVEAYANTFPLLNWTTLAGVTAEQRPIEPCSISSGDQWAVVNTAFVGGASDGRSGAIAHDTAQPRNLTARRAFFFFDDAVVGLGVNVTGRAALPVRTALMTRALPDARADPRGAVLLGFANGSTAALADAAEPSFFAPGELAFVAAGGLVALLPAAAASRARVGVSVGNVTGNWETIGAFSGNVTRRMLTAFLDHGVAPAGEAFAYVLAPNVSAADAGAAAAAGAGVACVTNGLDAQGAADVRGGLLAAVVWAPRGAALTCAAAFPPSGAPLALATDRDVAVLVRVNATHLVVSAAHPAAAAGGAAVHVTVSRAARAAPGCAPDGAASTVVTLALPPAGPFLGATTTVTCALV